MRGGLEVLSGFSALVLAGGALALPAWAQDDAPKPYHVRGVIESIEGRQVTLVTTGGASKKLALNEDAGVYTTSPARLADIAEGQFIGITSIDVGGKLTAIEVHIFDESLRGLAEGHYPWTLVEQPNMMTNAAVAKLVSQSEARELTVTYQEGPEGQKTAGTQTIVVPADAAVVSFDPGKLEDLAAGGNVFLIAIDSADGATISPAIVVGKGGSVPPM